MFHYIRNAGYVSNKVLDIGGFIQLSTFFILSGFSLALRYGSSEVGGDTKISTYWRFILKRVSRIAPLHYLTNIAAIWFLDNGVIT